KLFIRGLGYEATETDLNAVFSRFGTMTDCHVAKDRETGSSRGFAFVTYTRPDEATHARAETDNTDIGSRTISVVHAKMGAWWGAWEAPLFQTLPKT
ncbi:hypothetical protein M885DRAFT_438564, partial [Pelagophyceae sp. CCMP2097]